MKVTFIFVNDWCANVSSLLFTSSAHTVFFKVCYFPSRSSVLLSCYGAIIEQFWLSFLFYCHPSFSFLVLLFLSLSCVIFSHSWSGCVVSVFFFFISVSLLFSSVAWKGDGFQELHVVGYVYQELLVCTAHFTYIYAKSLSALYRLCLLYKQIQHIE